MFISLHLLNTLLCKKQKQNRITDISKYVDIVLPVGKLTLTCDTGEFNELWLYIMDSGTHNGILLSSLITNYV